MNERKGIFKVRDLKLAEEGRKRMRWAESRMPVLMALRERYRKTKPLSGYRIAGCLHVTKETAVLAETFTEAGAQVSWSGCNPLSTQDSVAAALAENGISIFAWHGQNVKEFYWAIEQTLTIKPNLTLDDGADLIFTIHDRHPEFAQQYVLGGTEETTTGVNRLRAMAAAGALKYPIIAVNDAETKWEFDNVYGTGQSTIDGIVRATSVLVAGKNVVIAGYGHCGWGVAMRAKGLGGNTIVTEVRPTAALRAMLDGHKVMKMEEAARIGDIFITATGVKDVIVDRHFRLMKDGAIVCNTGHYDCEVNVNHLKKLSRRSTEIRSNNEEYLLKDGRRLYLLAKGRLVNLAAAEGHPSEVMDMSFANQFMAQVWLVNLHKKGKRLENKVHEIPREQDQEIARLKLKTMGVSIDRLTKEQRQYIEDYAAGT